MVSIRQAGAMAKKQRALRDHLWPGIDNWLWQKKNKGFIAIPKTMPLILKILDEMTKGTPVSSTYLALWCATWDNNGLAPLNKPGDLANASGFGGQRGIHTWSSRLKKLRDLHFIDIKAGKSGPLSHALIYNPHFVIRWHHMKDTAGLTEASYASLVEWAIDIGATDMTDTENAPESLSKASDDFPSTVSTSSEDESGKI